MNYSKPEINILGDAKMVIEQFPHSKNSLPEIDGVPPTYVKNPAYDLDE